MTRIKSTNILQSTPDQMLFRQAMSKLAAGVTIVTTQGPAGRCGLTATAVCSVSDTPPTMLVCVNRERGLSETFKTNAVLGINVLASEQTEMAQVFAGMTPITFPERFSVGNWVEEEASGVPVLADALVSLQGRITQVQEIATHTVLFVEIDHLTMGNHAEALLYYERTFCTAHLLTVKDAPDRSDK